jgi:hypothetical protein
MLKKKIKMEKKFRYKAGVTYSHESPDGGATVYAREIGKQNRHLVYRSEDSLIDEESQIRSQYITPEAVKLCRQNKGLQKAWEKYIVLLRLSGFDD